MRRRFMLNTCLDPYVDCINISHNVSGIYTFNKKYMYADILFVGFGGDGGDIESQPNLQTGGGGSGCLCQVMKVNLKKLPANFLSYDTFRSHLLISFNGYKITINSGGNASGMAGGNGGRTGASELNTLFKDCLDIINIVCASCGGGAAGSSRASTRDSGGSGSSLSALGLSSINGSRAAAVPNEDGPGGYKGGSNGYNPIYSGGDGFHSHLGDVLDIQLSLFGGGGKSGEGGGFNTFYWDDKSAICNGGGGGAAGFESGGKGGNGKESGSNGGIGAGGGGRGGGVVDHLLTNPGKGGNAGIYVHYYTEYT